MKTKCLIVFAAVALSSISSLYAQGSAFTYQGLLSDSGARFTGSMELEATLWDAATNGTQILTPRPVTQTVEVSNGLFAVSLDFGKSAFDSGAPRWLQLHLRTEPDPAPFTTLWPRQKLTATPHAMAAEHLTGLVRSENVFGGYANPVTFDNPANFFAGQGSDLVNLNASALASGTVPEERLPADLARTTNVWLLSGNGGTTPAQFLGTTDEQALELRVNNSRALRLAPTASNDTVNVVGGSARNFVAGGVIGATIAGGGSGNYLGFPRSNSIRSDFAAIVGGMRNDIRTNSAWSFIGAGESITIGTNARHCVIGGGRLNNIVDNAFLSTIGGGDNNTVGNSSWGSTIGGGIDNNVGRLSLQSTISGGGHNDIGTNCPSSVIAGGEDNVIQDSGFFATIGGGQRNQIGTNAGHGFIGGGADNQLARFASYSAIVGGQFNRIGTAGSCFIGGGFQNTISNGASLATIPGGSLNTVGGDYSFAAGRRAKANHNGTFVWADSSNADFASTGVNQFLIRATGGVGIGNTNPTNPLMVVNARCDGEQWINSSDRNLKENFTPVNPKAVLEKVAVLPISQWNYRSAPGTAHLGPMAQDFKAIFGLGADDISIATVDTDGVALAAIQGLNQKLEERLKSKDEEIRNLRNENQSLAQRIERLEQAIRKGGL